MEQTGAEDDDALWDAMKATAHASTTLKEEPGSGRQLRWSYPRASNKARHLEVSVRDIAGRQVIVAGGRMGSK